jgi:hypothetical protein
VLAGASLPPKTDERIITARGQVPFLGSEPVQGAADFQDEADALILKSPPSGVGMAVGRNFDGPQIAYQLVRVDLVRRHLSAAMSGEILQVLERCPVAADRRQRGFSGRKTNAKLLV